VDRTPLTYLDFELEIGPRQGREYPVSIIRSPAGVADATLYFPFDELALENRLKDLQIALLRSGGERRQVLSPEEQTVQDFGRALFDALLTGEVRSRYDVGQREAAQQGKGLRLKLRIQPPELAVLPWEFMYDPRRAEYVCLSRHTPIVRFLELPEAVQALKVTAPLRILGMLASPSDLPPLDAVREKERVERALQTLQKHGLLELSWLEGQTWRDLQRAMRSGPWHIFHFIGHGGFDRVADEGYIALADEAGETWRLSATQLGRLLADHQSLRLVLLNSCEGARGGECDIFSSSASILVRRGIPAVLAMQCEISDRAAIEFARAFYEALAEGVPVDTAVAEARKAVSLAVSNTVEWGTPVLYTRAFDGQLFSVRIPEPGARHQTKPIRLASGWQAKSVPQWVKLAEQYWEEAAQLLYNGSLEKWLVQIDQAQLTQQAKTIRETEHDRCVGLERFLRSTGLVRGQDQRDVETNLDEVVRQLHYSKLRDQKSCTTFSLQFTNKGRGYLHGTVKSNVVWLDVPKPKFGCLPGQSAGVEVVFVPERFHYWRPSLRRPLSFALE